MDEVESLVRPSGLTELTAGVSRLARSAVATFLWLVFAANAAVIVWLWLYGGGISAVHTVGDGFTSLGRITGLLGAYLLLVQILLLARIPWFEHLAPFDRSTVWHRINGKVCLYLVLVHVVAITIGYTLMDRISIGAEISTLITSYPGMVEATIGTALIVLVAVSSFVIVRRRLRYEAWYLVHLTAYAGIWLSWFHEIPTGNELVTNATAAAYWTALYLVTLGLVVLFRFAQPALRGLEYRLRVVSVVQEGPDVVSLHITGRHLDKLRARAGQFFLWRFLAPGLWWESHPFSLSAAPDGRTLRITIKNLGDFSSRIGRIKLGTLVSAEGPYGRFTADSRSKERVALIAGGIGITPIRGLIEEINGDVVVLYRAQREDDLVFRDELEEVAARRGTPVHYVLGRSINNGGQLLSPDHMRALVPDIESREVFVCGPAGMVDLIEKNVRRVGVPSRYIHTERFAL